jgi:hypothetical protein
MWIALGQVDFRIRHAWVFLSCPEGPFGHLAPVVPCWGTMGGRCVSMVCPGSWDSFSPLNFDAVLVLSACGWRVWQVAPVFPLRGGPLALLKSPASLPQICQVKGFT